ncbi:MAG: Inositol 2-dehydrogenase [candidate division BRC1 bacterium ADurb.BinA364]|nr:MAG: Inositol 2-dehydrogenase [candidate division BRC1 bacterium ADurb.BinA364]
MSEASSPANTIRIGLVGCGGRGTADAGNCLRAAPNVELYAMGDLFADRLDSSLRRMTAPGKDGAPAPLMDKINVPPERRFVGFDAYKQVIASGVDIALFCTPPHFRPIHARAAVEAGVHVFCEKPVAVDPAGVRSFIATAEMAAKKNVGILAGTQFRHTPGTIAIMKRVRSGAIGDIVCAQAFYNTGGLWVRERDPEMSDMEWQIRNWLYFAWLSGDHIVEQFIHYIDLVNWAFDGPPVKAMGVGGRQARVEPKFGNIFDHFGIEFEYANGARVLGMCRQQINTTPRTSALLIGTKGTADPRTGIEGANPFKPEGEAVDGSIREHADFIASIHAGAPLNEGKRIAESTLTAILGRMAAYTGREISWNWALNSSKLDLSPPAYEFGPHIADPVAIPGITPLI